MKIEFQLPFEESTENIPTVKGVTLKKQSSSGKYVFFACAALLLLGALSQRSRTDATTPVTPTTPSPAQ